MLRHDFAEHLASLEEAVNRGLECLAEYGVRIGPRHGAGKPHPCAAPSAGAAGERAAGMLAAAAGVTIGVAAGLIVAGFVVSRLRRRG